MIIAISFASITVHSSVLPFNFTDESIGLDIHGKRYEVNEISSVLVDCQICGKKVSVNRYAPHLEKCLGVGGRVVSRTKKTFSGNQNNNGDLVNSPAFSSTPTTSAAPSPSHKQSTIQYLTALERAKSTPSTKTSKVKSPGKKSAKSKNAQT